jgi:hypothetical protein
MFLEGFSTITATITGMPILSGPAKNHGVAPIGTPAFRITKAGTVLAISCTAYFLIHLIRTEICNRPLVEA